MQLAVLEAIEVGLFQVPFSPANPYLFFGFWLLFLLAALIQLLLLRRRPRSRGFLILSLVGLIAMELLWQATTGWDRLAWLILWFAFLTMLAGASVTTLIRTIRNRQNTG